MDRQELKTKLRDPLCLKCVNYSPAGSLHHPEENFSFCNSIGLVNPELTDNAKNCHAFRSIDMPRIVRVKRPSKKP